MSFYDQEMKALESFKGLYERLNADTIEQGMLEQVYSEDLHFEDSFHTLQGRDAFKQYCREMYENVKEVTFEFHEEFVSNQQAILIWTMHYQHPRLNRGKVISVDGASHIRINDKVCYHKDFFDGGQLLYEQIPMLGSVIKTLKRRLA